MKVRWIVTLLLILMPVLAAAQTATHDQMRITVPFSFTISDQKLPAGTYLVIEREGQLMSMRNTEGTASYFVVVAPADRLDHWSYFQQEPKAKMVFHRYGEEYFLTEMAMGNATSWHVQKSPYENQYVVAGLQSQRVVVAGK
jgi:hypothetical protein